MTADIPTSLFKLIKKSIKGEIDDFTIQVRNNVDVVGYSGEVLFVTLTNKKSGDKQEMVVKQQLCINKEPVETTTGLFNNEIYFFDVILPKLQSFYAKATGKLFNFIPKCLATTKDGVRRLAYENVQVAGFKPSDKALILEDDHLKMLFKVYGVFHGISMAYKEKDPAQYFSLVNNIQFGWKELFSQMVLLEQFLLYVTRNLHSFFDPKTEENLFQTLKLFDGIEPESFVKLAFQESPHRVIQHGDSWSCNMMFKYNDDDQLLDVRLIDFQFISSGSPVNDLSYLFYSGARSFSNLDEYLKIYHSSLSDTLKEFGLDAGEVYSIETLKEEWRKYGKIGFFLGLIIWETKFANQCTSLHSMKDREFVPFKIADDKIIEYKATIRDLVKHMYENNFL